MDRVHVQHILIDLVLGSSHSPRPVFFSFFPDARSTVARRLDCSDFPDLYREIQDFSSFTFLDNQLLHLVGICESSSMYPADQVALWQDKVWTGMQRLCLRYPHYGDILEVGSSLIA